MRQTAPKLPLTQTTVKNTTSPSESAFDPFIHALTLAWGAAWRIDTLYADLATLQHPKGGVTISLSLHVQRQPQFLIYGNFKRGAGVAHATLNGDRGRHTLYRTASKTPEQMARVIKRSLLTAYWRDYAQAQAGCPAAHTTH
ncbi:hypothetical protein [Stenomitos frigidus]|uniref:Uncharacterized protein n=1 Tax=Stenomitos frigidus ULC18 TaxID=2107698 RepID=A0A2T1E811_9CYAN|nr:hypothetical protein [Stenomitos frigidus]PSB28871.1 hypothetical protein C7B82_12535 [Stenomitos frigidus ULC18]